MDPGDQKTYYGSGSATLLQTVKIIVPDPDPYLCFGPLGSGTVFISTTSQLHISLKTDVNIPTVRNKPKNFFNVILQAPQKRAGPGSGSVIKCTYPRVRIRIKMSRIPNTG
jgi:hypothetical protein